MLSETNQAHLQTMRASLQMLDLQLDRSALSAQAIADLKSEIDNMRLRLWGIMAADQGNGAPHALERFRLRRGVEILSMLIDEIENRRILAVHPEAFALGDYARRFIAVMTEAAREQTPSS